MGKLSGKVALITGGSRGIGRAIAVGYAREGAKVFITARGERDLALTAGDIQAAGGDVRWLAADLAKRRQIKTLVRRVDQEYGGMDILVNNASLLGPRETLIRYPIRAWEEVIQINLTAVFMITQEVLKVMVRQKKGSIINVSSGVGRTGKAGWGAYAASKFGVEGITQVLAAEVAEDRIRVNAVNPGATRTQMRAQAYPEEDPLTLPTPEEITGVFLYLASDESQGVTGKSFDARDWLKRPGTVA